MSRALKFLIVAALFLAACGNDSTVSTSGPATAGPAIDDSSGADGDAEGVAQDGGAAADGDAPDEPAEPADDGASDDQAADDGTDTDDDAAEDGVNEEPTVDIQSISGAAGVVAMEDDLPDDVLDCAIERLFDDRDLAKAVILSDSDDLADLSPEHFDAAIDIVLGCLDDDTFADMVVAGFEEEGPELSPQVARCFADEFDTVDERRALVKLGLAPEGEADPDAIDLVLDAIVVCVPPEVWIEAMTEEIADEPGFDEAFDRACMESVFGDDAFVRDLLTAVFNGELEDDQISPAQAPLIEGIFDCIAFGQLIALEAAADGIELQQSSIDCISTEFRALGLVDLFITGEEPDDEILGTLIFDCLTSDELAQLFG